MFPHGDADRAYRDLLHQVAQRAQDPTRGLVPAPSLHEQMIAQRLADVDAQVAEAVADPATPVRPAQEQPGPTDALPPARDPWARLRRLTGWY